MFALPAGDNVIYLLSYSHWFKGVWAAISIAAIFKNLKKSITIFFFIATVAFCILLYYFLFYTDHQANKILLAIIITGIISSGAAIVWLFNKYMKLPLQKGPRDKELADL